MFVALALQYQFKDALAKDPCASSHRFYTVTSICCRYFRAEAGVALMWFAHQGGEKRL
jgi:hypothetical protein